MTIGLPGCAIFTAEDIGVRSGKKTVVAAKWRGKVAGSSKNLDIISNATFFISNEKRHF